METLTTATPNSSLPSALPTFPMNDRLSSAASPSSAGLAPMGGTGMCNCQNGASSAMSYGYVYALGTIQARFPNMSVEKEYRQAVAGNQGNITERQLLYNTLSQPANNYLARLMCWSFSIQNIDVYVLQPQSDTELNNLIQALSIPDDPQADLDVVIGTLGPIAPPDMCNGLELPIVRLVHTYSFTIAEFVNNIVTTVIAQSGLPSGMTQQQFQALVQEVFQRLLQLADNLGELSEHRAVNYLALRYSRVYTLTAELQTTNQYLESVKAEPSLLSGARTIIDVIFTYRDRTTNVPAQYFTTVDVTGLFPFLVNAMQPYFGR